MMKYVHAAVMAAINDVLGGHYELDDIREEHLNKYWKGANQDDNRLHFLNDIGSRIDVLLEKEGKLKEEGKKPKVWKLETENFPATMTFQELINKFYDQANS